MDASSDQDGDADVRVQFVSGHVARAAVPARKRSIAAVKKVMKSKLSLVGTSREKLREIGNEAIRMLSITAGPGRNEA